MKRKLVNCVIYYEDVTFAECHMATEIFECKANMAQIYIYIKTN
jgi:hypothetical protein